MDEVVETSDVEELEELRAGCIRPSQNDARLSPPKRPKIHHGYDDSFSSSDEHPSPHFLSTSDYTSPASFPTTTPPVSATDPFNVVVRSTEDPFTDGEDLLPILEDAKSPQASIPPVSSSPPLDAEIVSKADPPVTPSSSQRVRSESVDPLLLFTPSRPSISDHSPGPASSPKPSLLSSPLSPLSSEGQRSPVRQDTRDSISPTREAQHSDDLELMNLLQNENQSGGRYSLRERNAQQKAPYAFDKKMYERTMRNNPDAIVKFRSPRRPQRREDNYEEDQTQQAQVMDNNAVSEHEPEVEGGRRSRSRSKTLPEWMHGYIMPLPLDEEEEEGFTAMMKEARRVRREQKKRESTRKRNKKTVKDFPIRTSDSDGDRRQSPHRTNSPDRRVMQKPSSRRASVDPPLSPPPLPPTPIFQDASLPSPSGSFHNGYNDVMELPDAVSLPSSPRLQTNVHSTPIIISDDEDERVSPVISRTPSPRPEFLTKAEIKQRKKLRALKRMFPAVMHEQVMADDAPIKRRRPRSVYSSDSEEEQPLLPGQTRIRRAANPRNLREVKGDTESSDDEIPQATDDNDDDRPSASEAEDARLPRKGRTRERRFSSWRNSEEEGLLDGRIDDGRIDVYLEERPLRGAGLQEKDMIDWMLANTAEVGGARRKRRVRKRVRKSTDPHPKIPAQQRLRQTRLSFDKQPRRGQSRARSPRNRSASPAPRSSNVVHHHHHHHHIHSSPRVRQRSRSQSRRAASSQSNDEHDVSFSDDDVPPPAYANPNPELSRKAARKQKEKERRARMKMNGVHIFLAPKGNRIDFKTFSLNVDDQGFHAALAPAKADKRKQQRPAKPKAQSKRGRIMKHPTSKIAKPVKQRAPQSTFLPPDGRPSSPPSVPDIGEDFVNDDGLIQDSDEDEEPLLLDFGVCASSVTFDIRTYTGKGFLAELGHREALRPSHFSTMEFDLGPNVSVAQFLPMFGKICNRFFDFATGLPEDEEGEAVREWMSLIGVTCRLLTWLLTAKETTEEEMRALKDAAETHVLGLTSRMKEANLAAQSMDSTTFALCWFAVELSVRSGSRLPDVRSITPNALQEACTMLIEQLLKYGLQQGMEPLVSSPDRIDGSTTAQRVFEMWVGVWIVAGKHSDSASSIHPVWKMVQTALMNHHLTRTNFEDSELVWRAIISLSAISQLCSTGKIAGFSRLGLESPSPTCWEIVLFALNHISLEAGAKIDDTVSESSLDMHDRYIKLVVERCCLLWSRWDWQLHDAFDTLCRLNVIFQSRKFANLRNEKADFPDFLRVDDWTLLSGRIHTETTFGLFLKLVYQTLLVNPSKVKKLLSLATPVGSLPWSQTHPPSLHELSMLFNRLSVIAIAIHVDPNQHARLLRLARDYVKFKDVDATTRQAYIRGFMYLSIVMIRRAIPLDEGLSWLNEMVDVLLDEHKRQKGHTVVVGLHSLVVSVRNIFPAFKGNLPGVAHRYPDPRLLLALERILRDGSLIKPDNPTAHILPRLIRTFLVARELAVPPPRRPPVIVDQESQDDYGMPIDDVFMQYLDQEDAEYKAKDKSLSKLFETNICWTLYRQLVQFCRYDKLKQCFQTGHSVSNDVAHLTGCWVACGNIVIQSNDAKSWSQFLYAFGPDNQNNRWPVLDDFCQRRLDFLVYSNVLRLDPMTYLDTALRDNFYVVLFEALASWYTTSEEDYIKQLLSIDGRRHPLLLGAVWQPQKDVASNEDLLTARLPLLRVIIENLSVSLSDISQMEDSGRYVRYCIKLFAAMKNNFLELNGDARKSYTSWCSKVHEVFQEHPNIVEENKARLGHHWTWLGSVTVNSTRN